MNKTPDLPTPAKDAGTAAGANASADSELSRWAAEDEDVQLMLRFKHGEQGAFDRLVERNTAKVHALVFRFLGEGGEVEDLAQEVFLRIYRTAPRYQPSAKFSTWLYRIVANLSFNVLRSRKKGYGRQIDVPEGEDDVIFGGLADGRVAPPSDNLHASELAEHVSRAIADLPQTQKVAIILNKYEQKSYDDIAEVLDCSVMAVKSLLSRARLNLRNSLERYLYKG
jgi:RNA polymerase sigma-70 factor (ECF subfamily)